MKEWTTRIAIIVSVICGLLAWTVTTWWIGAIVTVGAFFDLTDEKVEHVLRAMERDEEIRAGWRKRR